MTIAQFLYKWCRIENKENALKAEQVQNALKAEQVLSSKFNGTHLASLKFSMARLQSSDSKSSRPLIHELYA